MYNNFCITEQHRCSPSTQLNIKLAVAVLIAMLCASHLVCVCLCVYTSQAIPEGTPLVRCCRLETRSAILSAISEPTVCMTYIHRATLNRTGKHH